MTIGAPIDSSIRATATPVAPTVAAIPDSQANLDPTPQLVMTPGSEQFSFQFTDKLGDGTPQYQGYAGAGDGAVKLPGSQLDDFISVLIEKPRNKAYIIAYSIPFAVTVTGSVSGFGTGPGVASMPAAGTYAAGSNIVISLLGTNSASADFVATIHTTVSQG